MFMMDVVVMESKENMLLVMLTHYIILELYMVVEEMATIIV